MERNDTSDSWKAFVKELQTKCIEQNIMLTDFVAWISRSIQNIETRGFSYYISSGAIPRFPKQKIDANILLDNVLYGFTISDEREFSIYPTKSFVHYTETTSKDFVQCNVVYAAGYLTIADVIANSTRLREFLHMVLESAWGI